MSYRETSSQGFFGRLGGAIRGVLVGCVMLLMGSVLLFWNESRYVQRAARLHEGASSVVPVAAEVVVPANDGKLIHLSGPARPNGPVDDKELHVHKTLALRLRRQVEFYQWKENHQSTKRKRLGGGEETTTEYTYEQVWSEEPLDSHAYKEKGHENPSPPPLRTQIFDAPDARLGAFHLTDSLLNELTNFTATEGGSYRGKDEKVPAIGDVRVRYQVVAAGPVSLIGEQHGNTLSMSKGGILEVLPGTHSAAEMFQGMESANVSLTWILRLVGWLLCCVGFASLLGPFTVMADIIPFLGNVAEMGAMLFGAVLGSALALVCIALGWVVARPLVGIGMLLVAGGLAYYAFKGRRT